MRNISSAQKQSAVNNVLRVSEKLNRPVWANIIFVEEPTGEKHLALLNGYVLVLFKQNVNVISDKYSTIKLLDIPNNENLFSLVSYTGFIKKISAEATSNATNILPSLDELIAYTKSNNDESKYIKKMFRMIGGLGKPELPLAFQDSLSNMHLFNANYVLNALKLVCSSFDTDYQIYVAPSKIGHMFIKGDLGQAIVMSSRFKNNPVERINTLKTEYQLQKSCGDKV